MVVKLMIWRIVCLEVRDSVNDLQNSQNQADSQINDLENCCLEVKADLNELQNAVQNININDLGELLLEVRDSVNDLWNSQNQASSQINDLENCCLEVSR